MSKLSKVLAIAAMAAAVGAVSTEQANATLTFQLFNHNTTNTTLDLGAASGTVTVDLYATITGGTAPGMYEAGGSFLVQASGSDSAVFSGATLNTDPVKGFASVLATGGTVLAGSGSYLSSIGSTNATLPSDSGKYFLAHAITYNNTIPGVPVLASSGINGANSFLLGSATLNVSNLKANDTLTISFQPRARAAADSQIWFESYASTGTASAPTGALGDFGGPLGTSSAFHGTVAAAPIFTITHTGGPVVLKGDANGDGFVDGFDLNPFIMSLTDYAAFQAAYPTTPFGNLDVNSDLAIDGFDLNPFIAILTGSGSATMVPEPASLGLLALGGVLALRRKRAR